MITGAVINALLSALDAIFSLLPSWTFTPPGNDGVVAFISRANGVVPIHTAITLMLLTLGLIVILRTWDFGVFVFHQFWGSD